MRFLKISLSVLFVLAVCFLIVKGCVRKRAVYPRSQTVQIQRRLVPAPVTKPKMAIILDDWGNNFSLVENAIEIARPLTLSVLPHLPQSRRVAEEAYTHGLGVMLHMPMEPKNSKEPLEPHTIMTTTPDAEIVRTLDQALASVPHVEGMNNHMGSLATSDERVMRTVLRSLKERGLFFVDSFVISSTVAPLICKEEGIRSTKRDIFIDNELKLGSVKSKLKDAAQMALKRGKVVVIGHDKKITLEAIKEMVPEIEKAGVQFVLVKEIM